MTLRILPLALLALFLVACGDGSSTTPAGDSDVAEMDDFEKAAYAFGFSTAQGPKQDSSLMRVFDMDVFADGFRDGFAMDSSKIAYLFGYQSGVQLAQDSTARLSADVFLTGFRAGLDSDSLPFSDEELRRISSAVQDSSTIRQLRAEARTDTTKQRQLREIVANAATASAFLTESESGPGITKTESGLLYSTQQEGTGIVATPASVVLVNYVGRLADGTVFDQNGDEPARLPLQQMAEGFSEGVSGMKVGGKRTLYVPPSLGYGIQGTPGGPIPPNAALVFEVELLDVQEMPQNPQMQMPMPQQ